MDTPTMKCPKCAQANLVTTDRQGLEIDVCPTCRGVWLDRGELDKLIERSLSLHSAAAPVGGRGRDDDDDDADDRRERYRTSRPGDYRDHDDHDYPRRKRSWLTELFD